MEEYEVDLRDYIRVIWQKKWIIVGVFLVAVIAAAVFSFRSPNAYETEALLQLESPPAVKGAQIQMPSVQLALLLLKSMDLIAQTVQELEQAQITAGWLASNLTISNSQGNLLQLKLKGSIEPTLLKRILEKHIALFEQRIAEELKKSVERELERVKKEQKRLERQKQRALEPLEKRRDEMLQAIKASQEALRLRGSQVDTIIIWANLSSLYSRLQAIEKERDSLIFPIEQQLEDLSFLEEELNGISSLNPLSVINAAFVPQAPIGPNRRLNILIVGALGLLLGVLLAFFVHYMQGGKEPSVSLQVSKSQANKQA